MANLERAKKPKPRTATSPLMVRLDEESRSYLSRAAELRRITLSDYVREVTVAQARREVESALTQTIAMSPDEQLAFWTALLETPELTEKQRRLGSVMRGET